MSTPLSSAFESLISEAVKHEISGWDFSFIDGRIQVEDLSWNYREIVSKRINPDISLLDMGTGGGEFLASFSGLPKNTIATEGHLPNVPIARKKLEPLGIQVVETSNDLTLPFDDHYFELVINRHEAYSPNEVYRILKRGGRFISQQVGGENNFRLNELLQDNPTKSFEKWNLDNAVKEIEVAGFEICEKGEAFPTTRFLDIGAIVYYLRMIPWQFPDFTLDKYRDRLFKIHQQIQVKGSLKIQSHRFYFEALKS